jgi:2-polyprenyl-3-methyl-5-hydroxy-6-metoxy-1,4-benzoquinol methylase
MSISTQSGQSPLAASDHSTGLVLEETTCLLCGSSRWTTLVEAEDGDRQGLSFRVVRCERCGLAFTNPRPDAASIAPFYPPDYPPHRRRPRAARLGPIGWLRTRYGGDPQRHGPRWHGQGRLLDVGCASGEFLDRMHCRGWSVVGVDVSPSAVDYVRDTLGLPAFVGTLPHAAIPPASFDVVTLWQCLEHVHRPLELLRAAYQVLVPGGWLYVTVPNVASDAFRWFGGDWLGMDLPRHLVHFNPDTFREMLERAGFDVHAVRQRRSTSWLYKSAWQAHQHGRTGLRSTLRFRPLARLASWYAHLRGQSDCLLAVAARPQ